MVAELQCAMNGDPGKGPHLSSPELGILGTGAVTAQARAGWRRGQGADACKTALLVLGAQDTEHICFHDDCSQYMPANHS